MKVSAIELHGYDRCSSASLFRDGVEIEPNNVVSADTETNLVHMYRLRNGKKIIAPSGDEFLIDKVTLKGKLKINKIDWNE
jgi:hypothetical protein